jgi:hypothetical protein
VRRWAASFLLLLTVLLPLQPLLVSAQQEASLPACCRRNGIHHCMMFRLMVLAETGRQPFVAPASCPYWKIAVIPAVVATAISSFGLTSQATVAGHVVAADTNFFFTSMVRSQSARAPPVALL